MLKKTLTYETYDGEIVTEDLYFHIRKSVGLDSDTNGLDELEAKVKNLAAVFSGEERELTREETRDFIGLIRSMIDLGYGIRSADGKKFTQDAAILAEFKDTAAYEALLWGLFEAGNLEESLAFIKGIFPKEVREEAERKLQKDALPVAEEPLVVQEMTREDLEARLAMMKSME